MTPDSSAIPPSFLVLALIAYILGSLPFGLILTALTGAGDIRRIGSGNIGATNVLRTGRKGVAAATLLLDLLKGAAAVLLAELCFPDAKQEAMAVAAIGAVIGHCFPVWLKFRGGKGVATGLGTLWMLCWPVGLCCTMIWLFTVRLARISSLGALLAFFAAPLLMPALSVQPTFSPLPVAAFVISLLVWIRHYGNIVRLLAGEEPTVGNSGRQKP